MAENDDFLGFDVGSFVLREKDEILTTRVESDVIHSISRHPLAPLNFAEVKYPDTLLRFRRLNKKETQERNEMQKALKQLEYTKGELVEMEEMKQETEKMLGDMAKMEQEVKQQMDESQGKLAEKEQGLEKVKAELKPLEEEKKRNRVALRAGYSVMIRFFTEYACRAVTVGRTGDVSGVIKEAEDTIIGITHSLDPKLAAELPQVLDLGKHSATLVTLERLLGELSNKGCHCGSIAGYPKEGGGEAEGGAEEGSGGEAEEGSGGEAEGGRRGGSSGWGSSG